MLDWLCESPSRGSLFAGAVLVTLALIQLAGSVLLSWLRGRARVAEIEALSRATAAQIQEVGRVLLALSEAPTRRNPDAVLACPAVGGTDAGQPPRGERLDP